jgi:hypothetical protein
MITDFEHCYIYTWTDYDHRFRTLLYIRGQLMITDFEHFIYMWTDYNHRFRELLYIRGQIMITDFEHCYIYVDRL